MSSKSLLIFCDGTGMDGLLSNAQPRTRGLISDPPEELEAGAQVLFQESVEGADIVEGTRGLSVDDDEEDGDAPPSVPRGGGGSKVQNPSNVLRLSRAILPHTTDNRRQIVFYQSGVGSEADFAGDSVTGTTPIQAFGTAVASKIRDAYAFIAQNYVEGDDILIFGFSRGAYTARKLAGLIDRIGLLDRENLGFFFSIWRQLQDGKSPTIPPRTPRANIKCVAVWDTVGSVYNTIDALSIKDNSLPASIDIALHAVAIQENRKRFLPTLWTPPPSGLRHGQVLKQIWFPGAHSNVGGGYDRQELADLPLFWIVGEISSLVNLDEDFIHRSQQTTPDAAWGASQPHNAYQELPFGEKVVIGHETRLESGQITKDSVFHESFKYAPTKLTSPKYMETLDTLRKKFGAGWSPTYAPLNAFEQECKDSWGKRGITGPPPVFESPADLF